MTGGFSRKFGTQLGYGPTDMVARLPLLWRVAFTRYRKLSFAALITAPVVRVTRWRCRAAKFGSPRHRELAA